MVCHEHEHTNHRGLGTTASNHTLPTGQSPVEERKSVRRIGGPDQPSQVLVMAFFQGPANRDKVNGSDVHVCAFSWLILGSDVVLRV